MKFRHWIVLTALLMVTKAQTCGIPKLIIDGKTPYSHSD